MRKSSETVFNARKPEGLTRPRAAASKGERQKECSTANVRANRSRNTVGKDTHRSERKSARVAPTPPLDFYDHNMTLKLEALPVGEHSQTLLVVKFRCAALCHTQLLLLTAAHDSHR